MGYYYDKVKFLNNVVLHKIINIDNVLPTEKEYTDGNKRYVYDLTVRKTKNFCTSDLMCIRDTFHLNIRQRGEIGRLKRLTA